MENLMTISSLYSPAKHDQIKIPKRKIETPIWILWKCKPRSMEARISSESLMIVIVGSVIVSNPPS